ncbi:uncharacterized protein LOC132205938 [Neocloeon triangulifer]|uniref:uncharacterized protein LOC132205938 n=1 Tax=Neocloeon triangulifer TaxID=2078957 RepID=UPI00286F31AA|nr:uncharacterized protein LOC132205938 [Neocloeon triangulifer]XP_059491319.1 uncharacterized protein LOC132205938 [Neocloeon triangulifer]
MGNKVSAQSSAIAAEKDDVEKNEHCNLLEKSETFDNESESSELTEEDFQNRARYLCASIHHCYKVRQYVQLILKYETDDLKELMNIKELDAVRKFFIFEKRKQHRLTYSRIKSNKLFQHWHLLKEFKSRKEYTESNLLTKEQREYLDELLTFMSEYENFSKFVDSIAKSAESNAEDDYKLQQKLFRKMLVQRLVAKDIRKLEILLDLDYDDKYTSFTEIFEALLKKKTEIFDTKAKVEGIFESCPTNLSFEEKFEHYVVGVMKKAKKLHLIEDVSHTKYQVAAILTCQVTYNNEETTPLALLCEFATIKMFYALLDISDQQNGDDLFAGRLKALLPISVWTTPAIYSDIADKKGPSLVHYAAMNPTNDILAYLLENKFIDVSDLSLQEEIGGNIPLHFAALHGSTKCVDYILDTVNPEDPNKLVNYAGESPLHWAASGGDMSTFNHIYRRHLDEEKCLKQEGQFGPPILYAAKNNRYECMGLILDKQTKADATMSDEDCDTALHYISKEASSRWLAKILKANALLGVKNEVGNAPIDWISQQRLETLLDKHTHLVKLKRTKGDTSRKDHTEVIFTNPFGHHASGSDMQNIKAIAQTPIVEKLALHPLCQALVSVKWQKIKKFFLLKLLFFLPFVLSLSVHPILMMQHELRIVDNSTLAIPYDSWMDLSWRGIHVFLAIQVFFGLLSVFVLVPPFFKNSSTYVNANINLRRIKLLLEYYWEEVLWSDWYEYILWVIAFMYLADAINPILVVIASWFSLFYVCSNHPSILPFRYMLVKILLRYIKFLIFAIGLIGGFALGFFLVANKCKLETGSAEGCAKGFETIYTTMLKVPSMMMGEISFDTFSFEASPHLQFLFGAFIFLMTCCIFNMMNGLAINITTEFEKKAHIFSTIAQCEMICEFEVFLTEVHAWLKWLGLPGELRTLNSLWVERIKVKPSTGECVNLEEYDKEIHSKINQENYWETNDKRKVAWVWVNRGYTLDSKIIRAALERCKDNIYKDPADVEVNFDFVGDDDDDDGNKNFENNEPMAEAEVIMNNLPIAIEKPGLNVIVGSDLIGDSLHTVSTV